MKKRVLSLLLVLVMLLGLLPTAALAAPEEEPTQTESLTSDEIAQVPAVEEDVPATLSAVGSPTISLLTGNAHAHHGDNWNDGFKPYEGESKFASYDGSSSIQSSGLIISTKERDKFKNADYLWLPFTLSATVPAHSSITYNFSITLWHKRNSKGGVHYWVELLDGINDRAALNTGNNGNLSHGSLGRVCHSNKDGGSYTFNWTVTFDNYDSKAVKTVSHSMAYYVGACKSTSALTSYHHQVESSVTFNVKNTTLRKRITYDNNGGSGSTLAQVFSGSFIQLTPSPTRTGYNFRGWKDDVDGGVYAGNGSYTKERGAHMTAQWTAKNLNVTFDPNGGAVSQASKSVTYGQTYGALPTPTRAGYKFEGWTSGPTGGQVYYTHTRVTETKDHTLYAYWTVKTPTVTLNANGGSVSQTSKRAVYGDPYGALPTPTRTGYTFDGWYTAQTGGSKVDSATKVANGDDHTLYARWTVKTVAVTLNANGGTVTGSPKNVTYGQTYGDLPTPTRAGYTFTGWYTASSGGSKVESSTKVTNANAHTLYARWSRNTYTVTFNANGGSAVATRKVNAGDALGALPAPTKAGYTFGGWFSGDAQVTKDTVPTGNVTYTARWTVNTYTVTLDYGDGRANGSLKVTYGGAYAGLTTPTRVGYTFDGWYTAASGGTQVSSNTTMTTAGNHTLYAHWTAQTYTVTTDYNYNGGGDTYTVTYGGTYGDGGLPARLNRAGYTFDGWYTAPTGGTQVTASTKVTTAGDHTLYAHWTGSTCTATFNTNGGFLDDGDKNKRVTVGQPYGALPVPTWDGHNFTGWYTALEGGAQVTASTIVTETGTHMLYAHWSLEHTHALGAGGTSVTFLEATERNLTDDLPSQGGSYFLTSDLDITYHITVRNGQTLNLCLNGHKLTCTGTDASAILVQSGGTLNICDCNGSNGSHTVTSAITGTDTTIQGGLITRSQKKTSVGTGVRVEPNATFNLYGGAIAGIATAADSGSHGAVRVEGAFHMYGGEICHNKIGCGGGVNISSESSHFYLHGGSIHHNYASLDDGGAICVNEEAACTISGGSITDNVAKSGAGGIHSYGGSITLSGSPTIANNTTADTGKASNISVASASLTISEGFAPAKPIGVQLGTDGNGNLVTQPTAGSPQPVGTEGSGAYARYFLADTSGQEVVDKDGVLSLALHSHKVNPAAGSYAEFTALTAEMINSGTEEKTYTLPAGNYYLAGDITTEKAISIASGTVQLCLNGHKIENAKSHCISVKSGATLNICDCRGGGGIVCNYNSSSAYGIYNSGTVGLYSGAVSGTYYGIYSNGAVNVYGGAITGTGSGSTAGIHNYGGGTVNVSGGTITGNQSGINSTGTATVTGGSITGNSFGIRGATSGTISVSGGTITSNTHGIYLGGSATAILSGSPIIQGVRNDIRVDNVTFTVGSSLEGQFRVGYNRSFTEANPINIIQNATNNNQFSHFVPAEDGEGLRDVENEDGTHTLQLYKQHLHDGEEYENYIPTSKLEVLDDKVTLQDGGKYLLDDDLNCRVIIPAGATVDLCLNGYQLTFVLEVRGALNLYDCAAEPGLLCGSQNGNITVRDGGLLNWYGGRMDVPKTIYGTITLHSAMTSNSSSYPVYFAPAPGVTVTKDAPVIAAKNWTEHMGSSTMRYEQENGKYAVAEVNGNGDLVLRLIQVTMDGKTACPDYDTGKLTADDLAAPTETPAGYIWNGWYTAQTDGDKVTADTVFSRDATLYPRWTQCDHTANTTKPTVVPPTCTTAGSTTYTCSVCGLEVMTEAPALEHDFETDTDWYKDVDNGTHYHKCSRCDQRQDEAEHTWGETGTVTTAPTADADGVMTFTCAVCSATTTVAIPALVAHAVTYQVDDYTNEPAPTQPGAVKDTSISLPADGLTRTGYTLSGWALLDADSVPTVDEDGKEVLYTGTFTMPDRDVTLQVRWARVPNYQLQPGDTIVLPDGTVIKNETGGTVTIDQNGDGAPETTITLPGGGSVTIQEGTDGEKDKVVVPPGAEVTTTPGEGGQGPVITIGDGDGKVDASGKVDAPVGTTITDQDGNTITITGGEGGTVDPEGVVTFPEGTEGKVTVTDPSGNTTEVDVPGGGDGLDVTPGGVPLVNNPDGTLTIPDGQGGSTTVTVPDSDDGTGGAEVDDKGNLILPGGSTVETEDGEGNKTTTTVPDQGGSVTPGGDVGPRRPDRELFTVTDIDPEHVTGSIAISADADKMEWRKITDPESDWTDVGDTANATLDDLSEGDYQFRYKAEGELNASLPREIRVANKPLGGKALNIDPNITGGTVSAVRTRVKPGFEVRLTVKTNTGYRLVSITATYGEGQTLTPVWSANTLTYNFTMPDADVTVTAAFVSTAPPEPGHEHAWADAWTTSDTHHWHECLGEGACGVTANADKDGYGAHVYDDDQDLTCDVCGYTRAVVKPDPDTFTVTFDPQGGEPTPAGQTVAKGKLVTKPVSPAKSGHDFGGWFTEADGGKPWQFNVYTVNQDTTLYALWTARRPGVSVTPGDPVDIPGGGTVTKDPDTGNVTVTPPEGEGGSTTITPPEDGGDVTVDPDTGEVAVPAGSIVDPGNGTKVELPDGGKVDPEGNITLPDGGEAITVPDGEGGSTTITAPDGGGALKPTEDGGLEVPGGSTVKTGEDGPEITVPDEGGKVGGDGTITVPGGSTVTIPDGQGGKTQVTVPNGGEADVKPTRDGKVEVPEGAVVTKPDGTTVTVPSGGGLIDPATGDMTPVKPDDPTPPKPSRPSGSSSTSNKPSVSTTGKGGKVEADRNGNVTIIPDKGYEIDAITVNGKEVTVPADGRLTGLKRTDKVVVTFKEVPTVTVDQFTDVKPTDWYYGSVKAIVEQGLMNGTGETTFAPDLTTSRAMIATIIWRLEGSPEPQAELTYPDCVADSWYAKAVAWASEQGLVKGYGDGSFGPDDPITREQLAVMLWRYAGSPTARGTLDSFTDAGQAGSWATAALRWAVENGVLTGRGGNVLDPTGRATRAEAAAMLTRYCQSVK